MTISQSFKEQFDALPPIVQRKIRTRMRRAKDALYEAALLVGGEIGDINGGLIDCAVAIETLDDRISEE